MKAAQPLLLSIDPTVQYAMSYLLKEPIGWPSLFKFLAKFRTSFTYDILGTFITLLARRHWPKSYETEPIHYNVCDCQLRANDESLRARINFWPNNQETRLADQLHRGMAASLFLFTKPAFGVKRSHTPHTSCGHCLPVDFIDTVTSCKDAGH